MNTLTPSVFKKLGNFNCDDDDDDDDDEKTKQTKGGILLSLTKKKDKNLLFLFHSLSRDLVLVLRGRVTIGQTCCGRKGTLRYVNPVCC